MKNIVGLTLMLLLSIVSFGQKTSFGPEVGLNITPTESTGIGQNYHFGYHFGGVIKHQFSKKIKLSTGLFLSQKKKGYSFSSNRSVITLLDDFLSFGGGFLPLPDTSGIDSLLNIPGINTDITESTSGIVSELFIEVPFLANYKLKNINLYAGPYFGILLSASRKEEVTTDIPILDVIDLDSLGLNGFTSLFLPTSGTAISNKSRTTELRKFDLGFNIGIGYEMDLLHFNLMYSRGLFDYRSNPEETSKEVFKLYRFSVSYCFDLKKKSQQPSVKFE